MKTDLFPINYFKSVWSPIQAFKNRHQLNWFHLVIVLLFLNGLMTIPVTMNYTKLDSVSLESFYPNAIKIIDDKNINKLKDIEYRNGEMLFDAPFITESEYGIMAGGLSLEEKEDLAKENHSILFEQNQLIIKESNRPEATILYSKDFSLKGLTRAEEVVNEVNRQWFNQNRIFMVMIFSFMISIFLFVMLLLITFGSALFLYLTKKSSITSIRTYKESVNLILNLLTLPTFIAVFLSLIHFDITLMLSIQTLGLVLMLLFVFYKTKLNDNNILNTEQVIL
ncbi:Maltodextrin utilization protein YvdJ [Atopostipes suicloacalis DSM 15692]|uniref:Maltodextrin utilization protein YvdJ n=1 Tax=Atopostipes suicloacalis DSM 15692 TaxID=1121025 RepID=A0A1M4TWP3_9LACT|nr:DUF1189 family protein [Atopostipes suicloacalis]SHE48931.1 Maltodextrin utilization protein YvdJ [Atopostipes suicloacalis DSM 15692]